tara:strand:- start:9858 stop:10595 length:738 start_codon:yes stop_codon:yes gene_type:complete
VKNKNFIVVIPARYASKRLPGKPLKKIKGLSMIIRTCFQCAKAVGQKRILVATDNKKIVNECNKYGFKAEITSKHCLTGTDRVFEIAKKTNYSYYINVQGDEPIFNPKDLSNLIKAKGKFKNEVLLGFTKIDNNFDIKNKSIPKVVISKQGYLLYASRSKIPSNFHNRNIKYFRQVLAYGFPREKLIKFGNIKKKTNLETIEDIEILRFLELGIKVKMISMSNKSVSVDLNRDLKKVVKILSKNS